MLKIILQLLKPKPPDVSLGEYNQLLEMCIQLQEEINELKKIKWN